MKRILFLLLLCTPAFALKTVTAVTVSPYGAVVAQGDSLTHTTSCTYSDLTTDACVIGNAGSPTVTSYTSCYTMSGLVGTWSASGACDPANNTSFPSGKFTAQFFGQICYQGVCDKFGGLAQHIGDIFYPYITPDYRQQQTGDGFGNTILPLNVVVGAHPQIGLGFIYNNAGTGTTGTPGQFTCNYATSDATKATIDRFGQVTAIAAGNVTMTCNPFYSTNAVHGASSQSGWTYANGGNGINLVIVNPSVTTPVQWYARGAGGSYYNASTAPGGDCDGLSDLPAAGATAHHCALYGLAPFVWNNDGSHNQLWVIAPGDIINIDPADGPIPAGMPAYNVGPSQCFETSATYYCYWIPPPSGVPAQHTIIRGTNYANCSSDANKSVINGTGGANFAINILGAQFLDLQCVKISQADACGPGVFNNACGGSSQYAADAIRISALNYGNNFTDVYIYGMAQKGIFGASGYNGLNMNRVHIQGMPYNGIDMDDITWGSSNISVSGGLTMTNSIVEWTGCIPEKPAVHAFPYIECRDSSTNSNNASPDGIGEGSTSGFWSFDHVIMRYNWQDDFDLLHSGMQYLSITNSQAYGSIGAAFKMGPADTVQILNNQVVRNCQRMSVPVGDQPPTSIIGGANYCRGNDWLGFSFAAGGSYTIAYNSMTGYQDTILDYGCSFGYTASCASTAIFQNNTILGYGISTFNSGQLPGIFGGGASLPFFTHDYNNFYNIRNCFTLSAHETCNSANPLFTSQPSTPMPNQTTLDSFNFLPTNISPLVGAGLACCSITTDINGTTRTSPPWIGSLNGTITITKPTFTGAFKFTGSAKTQ